MRLHGYLCIPGTLLLLMAALLSGCATTKGLSEADQLLIQHYQKQAEQAESSGDLRQALINWKRVAAVTPGDAAAVQKVTELEQASKRKSQAYFQEGLRLLERNKAQDAQRSFLAALYLDPDHSEALAYLRAQLGGKDKTLHTLKQGESLSLVADRYYGDVHRYDVIAHFNDLDPNQPVHPGQVITVPSLKGLEVAQRTQKLKESPKVLEESPVYPEDEPEEVVLVDLDSNEMEEIVLELSLIRRMLANARRDLQAARYPQAADQAAKILEIDPSNSEAVFLLSDAHYLEGERLAKEGEYERAITRLEMVHPGYKKSGDLLFKCRSTLADAHYRNGVKCFAEEKLQMAAAEFRETIRLNPDHPKAGRDLAEVEKLIEQLKRFD